MAMWLSQQDGNRHEKKNSGCIGLAKEYHVCEFWGFGKDTAPLEIPVFKRGRKLIPDRSEVANDSVL